MCSETWLAHQRFPPSLPLCAAHAGAVSHACRPEHITADQSVAGLCKAEWANRVTTSNTKRITVHLRLTGSDGVHYPTKTGFSFLFFFSLFDTGISRLSRVGPRYFSGPPSTVRFARLVLYECKLSSNCVPMFPPETNVEFRPEFWTADRAVLHFQDRVRLINA